MVGVGEIDDLVDTDVVEEAFDEDVEAGLLRDVADFDHARLDRIRRGILRQPPGYVMHGVGLSDAPVSVDHHLHGFVDGERTFDAVLDGRLIGAMTEHQRAVPLHVRFVVCTLRFKEEPFIDSRHISAFRVFARRDASQALQHRK